MLVVVAGLAIRGRSRLRRTCTIGQRATCIRATILRPRRPARKFCLTAARPRGAGGALYRSRRFAFARSGSGSPAAEIISHSTACRERSSGWGSGYSIGSTVNSQKRSPIFIGRIVLRTLHVPCASSTWASGDSGNWVPRPPRPCSLPRQRNSTSS